MWISALLWMLFTCSQVQAKAVFAQYYVEQTPWGNFNTWETDFYLAQIAHIDAFSLQFGSGNLSQVTNALDIAFATAETTGFHLYLTFEYGDFPVDTVVTLIQRYSASSAYYKHNGRPMVSTWNTQNDALADWQQIKSRVDCWWVPQWDNFKEYFNSTAAPNGLISYFAWAWQQDDVTYYLDSQYQALLRWFPNSTYTMSISPWYYENRINGHNFIWKGEDQWYDRWTQALILQPDYIIILSWNSYTQSAYIGPLYKAQDESITDKFAPFNYVSGMPHDGWRMFLPYLCDTFKTGLATIGSEGLNVWYRLTPKDTRECSDGNTTANLAEWREIEYRPQQAVRDNIYYAALLGWEQQVKVTVNGTDLGATWTHKPYDGVGLYRGSVAYGKNLGNVVVTVGAMTLKGKPITTNCSMVKGQKKITNWNAWVGSVVGNTISATPTLNVAQQSCIEGHGLGLYAKLCKFSCPLGYCPLYVCVCTALGAQPKLPDSDTPGYGTVGYPIASMDDSFTGLCSWACSYGYCPSDTCGTQQVPLSSGLSTPYRPPSCTSGFGAGNLASLCNYGCHYGFCPVRSCTCESQGVVIPAPPVIAPQGSAAKGVDPALYGLLCEFSCPRGFCPPESCTSDTAGNPSSESTSSQSTPSQSTPSQSTPSQSTPSQSTPVQPTSVQPTPVQPTPVQPTSAQPTPAQPSAPVATHAYDIYQWSCPGPQQGYHYNVGLVSGNACSSLDNEIGTTPPAAGQVINVCGGNRTFGSSNSNGGLQIGDKGVCRAVRGSVTRTGCSDKSMVACTVSKVYECSDVC